MNKHLTVEFEQEDQNSGTLLIYQAIPESQLSLWLQSSLSELALLNPNFYPEFAKTVFTLFSDFYIAIFFVDSVKSQSLNQQYRHKNYPTNILSFPSPIPIEFYQVLPKEEQQFTLGDLVIDLSIIQKEANTQHKLLIHHLAHILIHGMLHLLQFDHELPGDAIIMEKLETQLLHKIDIPNPYESIPI